MSQLLATYVVSHALVVVTTIASFVVLLRVLESRRTSQSTVAWLLAIVFVPVAAIPLYLLLGARKFPRRAKGPKGDRAPVLAEAEDGGWSGAIARVLRTSGVHPPQPGNAFELLTTGEAAFERLMGLIRGAERSIDLTVFILGDDATGRAVIDALVERASKGVDVRMVLDAVGSARSLRHAARALGAAGAEVQAFMPLRHSPIRGRTNLRSHRKLAIFDSQHVFTGGMNFAGEYMGLPLPAASAPRWRDVAAVASGPVVADAASLFESDWAFCGGSRRPRDDLAGNATPVTCGAEVVQVVPSGPDMTTDTVYDLFLTGIFGARDRIAIVTPYYVPDELLQHALILAARRGVQTELIVPAQSNHRIADVARRNSIRELSAAGAVVYYYEQGMVHAKAMVVDDSFAFVGSPNFDMRSLFLNYENALCVYSSGAIGQIRAFVEELMAECATEGPFDRQHWVAEQIARFLAPEL